MRTLPFSCCSGHGAWQILIAYEACIRLCLRAWATGCMEAPEFLRDECAVLRNAFGYVISTLLSFCYISVKI
jgi:hypothetical protein